MMKKILSRKLGMSLAGAIGAPLAEFAATGTVSAVSLSASAAVIVGYCVSQGWVDGKKEESNAKPE
jgi:hypothetical protein